MCHHSQLPAESLQCSGIQPHGYPLAPVGLSHGGPSTGDRPLVGTRAPSMPFPMASDPILPLRSTKVHRGFCIPMDEAIRSGSGTGISSRKRRSPGRWPGRGDSCFLDVVWRTNSGNNSRIQTHPESHSQGASLPREPAAKLRPGWGLLPPSLAGMQMGYGMQRGYGMGPMGCSGSGMCCPGVPGSSQRGWPGASGVVLERVMWFLAAPVFPEVPSNEGQDNWSCHRPH